MVLAGYRIGISDVSRFMPESFAQGGASRVFIESFCRSADGTYISFLGKAVKTRYR